MSAAVATNLIVFGRGLDFSDNEIRLTSATAGRVDAALGYIAAHADSFLTTRGRIVFSGGYAGASEGITPPAVKFREGALMLQRAQTAKIKGLLLADFADIYAEIESDSTLENFLRIQEQGYFDSTTFTPQRPLGLVAHAGHMRRIDYFTRRVFGLGKDQTQHIIATNEDHAASGISESTLYSLTRILYFGAHTPRTLRQRERFMKRMAAVLRRIFARHMN